MKKLLFALLSVAFLSVVPVFGQTLDYDKLAPHPRLLLKKGDVTAIKQYVAESANGKKVHDYILAEAEKTLALAPVERTMTGRRLLSISRVALRRIFYLSYAYLTTEDTRYALRAEKEMLAVCEFSDWNPSHFLDVGEMTLALAIGYDWLYRYLPVHSRSIIGTAIYEKGLLASENNSHAWFFRSTNNWNQVCNAGMIFGALATMERSPEYCKSLIAKCLESNPLAQKFYDPDGAYPEGYAYWEYGTTFEVMLVAALQSALGTDAGIKSQKSFMNTANFMTYMVAPSGRAFNYFDSGDKCFPTPAKYWFARECNDASIVAIDERFVAEGKLHADRLLPLQIIFASSLDLRQAKLPSKNSWTAQGEVPVYIYRSGWTNPNDAYFAIKGGRASSNHGHMDSGSFIYEYDGVRWAVDLGMHDYNRLEQAGVNLWNMGQTSSRWNVFRIGAESHNTLVINGQRHNVQGRGEITETFDTPRSKGAVVNLTEVFVPHAREVVRRAELDKNNHLVIRDHIVVGDAPAKVEWKIATMAQAELVSPQVIKLTQDGKTMYLKLNSRLSATAKIWPEHKYMDCEIKDEGLSRVGFVIDLNAGETADVEVMLSPNSKKGIKIQMPKLGLSKRSKDK